MAGEDLRNVANGVPHKVIIGVGVDRKVWYGCALFSNFNSMFFFF